jgi:hypothetical protein
MPKIKKAEIKSVSGCSKAKCRYKTAASSKPEIMYLYLSIDIKTGNLPFRHL